MFLFLVMTLGTLAKAGVSWNHDASLIKFNQYEYTHHFEIYDAWRDNNKVIYRGKEIEMKLNTFKTNENEYSKF